jgi:hypothetical protein
VGGRVDEVLEDGPVDLLAEPVSTDDDDDTRDDRRSPSDPSDR